MNGYLRILAIEFDAWNDEATTIANQQGMNCDRYTNFRLDTDSNYVWARVENDFIVGDILPEEEAINQGMVSA